MNPGLELANPFSAAKIVAKDVDPADYHRQMPGIERGNPQFVMTRSALMAFSHCPAKWRNGWTPKDTDATAWGSLIDCLALMRPRFHSKYAITPKTCTATAMMKCVQDREVTEGAAIPWNGLSGEAKAWKKKQEKAGLTVLSAAEHGDALAAMNALLEDRQIADLLNCADSQVLVIGEYTDKETGLTIAVKSLIDLVPRPGSPAPFFKSAADFKTARNGSPGEWEFIVDKLHYDAQAAMSLWLLNAANPDGDYQTWFHAGQENEFPFQTFRRWLTQEFIELGRGKILSALKSYCACLKANRWPDWDEQSNWTGLEGWSKCEPPNRALTRPEKEPMRFAERKVSYSEPINNDNENTP